MKNWKDVPTSLAPVTEDRKPHTLPSMSKLFTTFQLRLAGNSVTSLQNHRVKHLCTGFAQTCEFQIVGYIGRWVIYLKHNSHSRLCVEELDLYMQTCSSNLSASKLNWGPKLEISYSQPFHEIHSTSWFWYGKNSTAPLKLKPVCLRDKILQIQHCPSFDSALIQITSLFTSQYLIRAILYSPF